MFAVGTFTIDNLIVGHTLGATQLAYYLIAFNAASWLVTIVGGAINQVAGPAFAEYRRRESAIDRILSQAMVWVIEAGLPCSALLIALADPMVRFLYGDRYAPAIAIAQILAVLGLARLVVNLGRDALVADQRERRYATIQIIWFFLVAVLVAAGAARWGLAGAAWGHVSAAVLIVVILFTVLHREMGVHATFLRGAARPLVGSGCAAPRPGASRPDSMPSACLNVGQLVVGGVVGVARLSDAGFDRGESQRS